ncbi:SIMPL domain-containing protein [Sphingomonas sp.]|uniref:SIMPL domain-containing protein n=1 Tax=Sphingomonas sp. TaxID=28214 RepID=UPI0035C7A5CC
MRTIAFALALAASPATAQLQPGETLLEVEAQGEVSVAPDTAFVSAGVVTTGQSAAEATAANAQAMAKVIAAVRGAGVEPRHIRTQQISVEPQFAPPQPGTYRQDQTRITGYLARNSVAVTVTRLAIASQVIDAAFGAGANSVNGPDLGLLDDTHAVAAARADALAKAKAQAEAYASGLGLRIARVIRISERGRQAGPEVYVTSDSMMSAAPAPVVAPPPLSAGDIRQNVSVWIDYALVK